MWKSVCGRALLGLSLCSLIALSTVPGLGQATTAAVLGTVTDATGATIPDASVTITNLDTNDTRTAQTNSAGAYLFDNLIPANYRLVIKREGFKTVNIDSFALASGDRHRVDETLEAGGSTTTVEVTTSAPVLQTDTSSLASTVTEQAVQNLPLNGRNYIQLTQLVAGANEGPQAGLSSGTRPDDRRQSSSVSVNGQQDVMNDHLIDGMDNNERIIGTIGVRPSIDAISEVRLLTNSYEADAGRSAGAIVNIITKSGTNQFHGSLYEYFRNDALNAYSFQFGAHNPKPELRQNQFGGSIGGPIIKNRTFFFFDIEGFRLVQGNPPSSNVVPTLYEEQHPGDFSDHIPSNCASGTTAASQVAGCVYDKYTGAVIPSNIVPVDQRDPVGLLYLQLYPAPNVGSNAYVGSRNRTQFSTVYDIRIDHKISEKDSIFGRWTNNSITTFTAPTLPIVTAAVAGIKGIDPQSGYNGLAPQDAHNIQLNYTHTFTPNLLLLLGAGYTYIKNLSQPLNTGLNPNTAFGQPGINVSNITSALAPVIPTGETGLGAGGYFIPLQYRDNDYQLNGSVIYSRGRHSLKAGAALIRRITYDQQDSAGEGYYSFTAGLPGVASGFYSSVTRNNDLFAPYFQVWEPSVFFQDDWRVNSKLTLNLGARYEYLRLTLRSTTISRTLTRLPQPFLWPESMESGERLESRRTIPISLRASDSPTRYVPPPWSAAASECRTSRRTLPRPRLLRTSLSS